MRTIKKVVPKLKFFQKEIKKTENTLIYNKNSEEIDKILTKCTELQKQFKPFKLLFHHHLQTTVAALKKSQIHQKIHREMFHLKDDYSIWIDRIEPENSNESTPSIFIMPGLASGLQGCGISNFINYSLKNNFRCFVFNYLDNSRNEDHVKTIIPGVTHSLPEIFQILEELQKNYPKSNFYGVGFSLGSNILLKFCGEYEKPLFKALVSVSNPFDLHVAATQLQKTVNSFLYDRIFMKKRRALYERNPHILEQKNIDPQTLNNLKSTLDLDRISAKLTGIDNVETFYEGFSCKKALEHIKVPLLCLNSKDDPISHPKAIPIDVVDKNHNIIIYLANGGGHLGFFDNWLGYPTFIERSSIEFLSVIHEINKKN